VLPPPQQAVELAGLDYPRIARPKNLRPQALLVPPFLTKKLQKTFFNDL